MGLQGAQEPKGVLQNKGVREQGRLGSQSSRKEGEFALVRVEKSGREEGASCV